MIPYSCDAPLFYRPIGTVLLIVLNVLAYAAAAAGLIDPYDGWMVTWGDGLHPVQWLLSMFMHAGPGHLIGNMLFLWVFGFVVEGRLGIARFISCYLAIGASQSAIEQLVMLGYDGLSNGSLGASSAICGLMAMACVWSPMNELSVLWLLFPFGWKFEITIGMFSFLYLGYEALMIVLTGGQAGSSWLHLGGAMVGFPLGAMLLKTGVVDGEDWDLFSVLSGTYGAEAKEKREQAAIAPEIVAQREQAKRLEGERKVGAYLEIGKPSEALAVRRRMDDLGIPLQLDESQLLKLIQLLHERKLWTDSAPVMAEYLQRFTSRASVVRLKLAQICLVELERPHLALNLIGQVDAAELNESQRTLRKKIAAAASRQIAAGAIELDDPPW